MIDNIFKIKNYLLNHYLLFLLILVFISYGQLLFMQPWQEDNVIFFKVAHINERAGYLGEGIWGSGVYRHIITPYYLLYTLVGYNIPLFYALALTSFFLATVSIYYLFKNLINDKTGQVASFLFGAGYIAYDGFVRIYNSISSSSGIVLLSLLFISYWRYFKSGNLIFYFLAVLFYYLTVEFSYIRAHYLIAPLIVFEFIFFCTKIHLRKILSSILRLLPFLFIFYKLYVIGTESRKESTIDLLQSIITGKLENTFSFFVTVGNLVVPDKIQQLLLLLTKSHVLAAELIIFIIFLSLLLLFTRRLKKEKYIVFFTMALILCWIVVSKYLFSKATLIYSSVETILAAFLGGLAIIIMSFLIAKLNSLPRKMALFFLTLILTNIAAYSAYTPTTPYPTGYRYLAHSLIGLIGIVCLVMNNALSLRKLKYPLYAVIAWGGILLFLGVTNMHSIVENKSNRIEKFYNQLKSQVNTFPAGSFIYFDIQDHPQAKSWFDVSFSVAEMPNSTAIAWRYGIDRYDIKMFTDFPALLAEIKKNNVPASKVYTFWLTKDNLFNTTDEFRKLSSNGASLDAIELLKKSFPILTTTEGVTKVTEEDIVLDFKPVKSLVPMEVELLITASPLATYNINFPLQIGSFNKLQTDLALKRRALEFEREKEAVLNMSKFKASSEWKENILSNVFDSDVKTFWQADRVLWGKEKAEVVIDLQSDVSLGGLAIAPGNVNNAPISYTIEISQDGEIWQKVVIVSKDIKVSSQRFKIDKFIPTSVRFIRIKMLETISGDSPILGEIWPVPAAYSDANIEELEELIARPFDYIGSFEEFQETLLNTDYKGTVQVYWLGDKSNNWLTNKSASIHIVFDGQLRKYKIVIPAQGTEITGLKISDFTIPGEIIIKGIGISSQKIY